MDTSILKIKCNNHPPKAMYGNACNMSDWYALHDSTADSTCQYLRQSHQLFPLKLPSLHCLPTNQYVLLFLL